MIGRRLGRSTGAAAASTSVDARQVGAMGAGPGTGLEGPVVLEATGLVKRCGDHAAVDGIDHFYVAKVTAFNPNVDGTGFEWTRLAVLAAWAVGGAVAGARFFRWTPTEEH